MLKELTKTLIDLGVPASLATNTESAHHRFIRSTVDNQPSLQRIAEFMDDFRDEHGNELADLAIAHGAIMYFTRTNQKVKTSVKEKVGSNKEIKEVVAQFQSAIERPEYDYLAVEEEYFDIF